jgi:hypothetical protein
MEAAKEHRIAARRRRRASPVSSQRRFFDRTIDIQSDGHQS